MPASRRAFLQLLAAGVVGAQFDVERLLWVPGQKKIFIPPPKRLITEMDIIAAEMDRILPHMKTLFENDDVFYQLLPGSKEQEDLRDKDVVEIAERRLDLNKEWWEV